MKLNQAGFGDSFLAETQESKLKKSLGRYMRGNIVKNTTCLEKILYSKNKTTCFGLYWPSSGFYNTFKKSLRV